MAGPVPCAQCGGHLLPVSAWQDRGGTDHAMLVCSCGGSAREVTGAQASPSVAARTYCTHHGGHDLCAKRAQVYRSVELELGEPLVPGDEAVRAAHHRRQVQLLLRRFAPGDRIWPGEPS